MGRAPHPDKLAWQYSMQPPATSQPAQRMPSQAHLSLPRPAGAGLPPGRRLCCPAGPRKSWLPTRFMARMGASTRLSKGGRLSGGGPPRGPPPPRWKSPRPDCWRSIIADRLRLSASSLWISSIVLGPSACTAGRWSAGLQLYVQRRGTAQSRSPQQHSAQCSPPAHQPRRPTSLRSRQRFLRCSMRSSSMKRWRWSRASLPASCSMRPK